jgi:hypothetical protein
MELAPKDMQDKGEYRGELISDESAREIAIMALISAVKDIEDYSSGQDFPNIPFGD